MQLFKSLILVALIISGVSACACDDRTDNARREHGGKGY